MPPKAKPRKKVQPVKGGLKAFADAKKSHIGILNEIRTHVVARANENQGVGREAHKIHVSELVKDTACPRQMFYKVSKTPKTDNPKGAYHRLEMIWAAGHAEHEKWQRWIREMGVLQGTWKCHLCSHQWVGVSPEVCPNCGDSAEFIEYKELELEVGYVVGHADAAVVDRSLIEIKSFSVGTVRIEAPDLVRKHTLKVDDTTVVDIDSVWAGIKRPLKSHLRQGVMYLWMCKQMGIPYESIVYIYENKANQDTKAFEVRLSERVIRDALDMIEEVEQAVADNEAPARPKDFVRDGKPCNECLFRTHCWSEGEDDQSTESPRVQARRSRIRGQASRGEAEVSSARKAPGRDARGAGRRDGSGRQGSDRPDDADDTVDRASRRATGDVRGGRAVGRSRDGQGARSGVSGSRQGRDRA